MEMNDEHSGRAKSSKSADICMGQAAKAIKNGGAKADEKATAHHASMKAYLTGEPEDHMSALMAHKTLANKLDADGDDDASVHDEMAKEHAKHAAKPGMENRTPGGAMLLNRDFKTSDDGWYHIVPRGEFPHPKSGLTQVLDKDAGDKIVNRFQTERQATNYPGILVDFDHFSQDEDKSSEAAGWIENLQNRDDGVWAKIRWSDIGKAAVEGGRYRLVSPVWNLTDCEQLENKRVRPLRIDTVALTNDPNLKGLTPLSNRAGEPDARHTQKTTMDHKAMLANLLGLAVTAADAEFEASVALANQRLRDGKELQNRTSLIALAAGLDKDAPVEKIVNRCTELASENTTLKTGHQALLGEQVERDLVEFQDVISDKVAVKANLLANRAGTIGFLKALKKPAGSKQPLHNRNTARNPDAEVEDTGKDQATEQDRVMAAKIGNRAASIKRENPRMSFDAAWRQATAETERTELAAK